MMWYHPASAAAAAKDVAFVFDRDLERHTDRATRTLRIGRTGGRCQVTESNGFVVVSTGRGVQCSEHSCIKWIRDVWAGEGMSERDMRETHMHMHTERERARARTPRRSRERE